MFPGLLAKCGGVPFTEHATTMRPGGAFDPLGLADAPHTFAELKVTKVENGRLAMFSFLGYAIQTL